MICIYAHKCNSDTCLHKRAHPTNDFCYGGSCSWGTDTHCVPETKRERVEDMLKEFFSGQNIPEIADRIEEIYEEVI